MSDRQNIRHLPVENAGLTRVDQYDEAALIRRADQMRGEVLAEILRPVGRAISRVFASVIRSIEQAQAMRVLYQMDDETLKDIGISREQIPSYVIGLTRDRTDDDALAHHQEAPRQAA